jgi:dienelactone hydrolase
MFFVRNPWSRASVGALAVVCLTLVGPGAAFAQAPVRLSGMVTDPTGRPVAGARLEIASQGLSATTDANGRYLLVRGSTGVSGSRDLGNPEVTFPIWARYRDGKEAFTLEGRRFPAHPSRDPATPQFNRPPGSTPLAKPSVAGDTLTLIAVGYPREDRPLPLLSGTEDFRLKALSHANVPYKTGAGLTAYEVERCRLDVHIPASAAGRKLPVVLHFHGGGLHGGDKNEGWFDSDNWFSRKLMEEGLMIFSANYRLGQDPDLPRNAKHVVYPAYLRDAASAVAWVRRNLESYGGDPENFFVSGFSAGAWLAAMLAVDTSHYRAAGFRTGDLNGYLIWSAQTYTYGQVAWERGISDRDVSDGALMHYVRKHDIPMALFVGGNEGQRIADMQTWHQRMLAAGSTRMTLSVQAGRDHKQLVTTMGNAVDDTRAKAMAFIRQYSR